MTAPPKHDDACGWTVARISELSIQEINRLLDYAEQVRQPTLVERCRTALRGARSGHREIARPKPGGANGTKGK